MRENVVSYILLSLVRARDDCSTHRGEVSKKGNSKFVTLFDDRVKLKARFAQTGIGRNLVCIIFDELKDVHLLFLVQVKIRLFP